MAWTTRTQESIDLDKADKSFAVGYWPNRGITIAVVYFQEELYIGVALKSPKDVWKKTTGKRLAIHRAKDLFGRIFAVQNHAMKLDFDWSNPPINWISAIHGNILVHMRSFSHRHYPCRIDSWRPHTDDGIKVMKLVRQAIIRAGHKDRVPSLENLRPTLKKKTEKILAELKEEK